MGLSERRRSGKIIGGSGLVVPGQDIYSVKVFPNSFQFKRGTSKELIREVNPSNDIIKAILVDQTTFLSGGDNIYITYVE
jgi:hypothetical protein